MNNIKKRNSNKIIKNIDYNKKRITNLKYNI